MVGAIEDAWPLSGAAESNSPLPIILCRAGCICLRLGKPRTFNFDSNRWRRDFSRWFFGLLLLDDLSKLASKSQWTTAWSSPRAIRSRDRRLSKRGRGNGVVDFQPTRRFVSLVGDRDWYRGVRRAFRCEVERWNGPLAGVWLAPALARWGRGCCLATPNQSLNQNGDIVNCFWYDLR